MRSSSRDLPPAPADGGLLFVGSFGHFPNLDAALWLCEEIWPRLQQVGAGADEIDDRRTLSAATAQ